MDGSDGRCRHTKHRGSAYGDEIVPYRITEAGFVL